MINCGLMKFKEYKSSKYGNLVPIEGGIDIPFSIKRIYYIFDVDKDVERGFHAHRKLHQILICMKGNVKIKLKNYQEEVEEIKLNNPSLGLYIGPMIWREMCDFSEDCVLLVLASDYYDENDYIRNYDFYLKEVKEKYNN